MTQADYDAIKKHSEQVKANGKWINPHFLKDLIAQNDKKDIDLLEFDVRPAVGPFDNNMSVLYKTEVKYAKKGTEDIEELHLIIKGEPADKFYLEIVKDRGVFPKEIAMYTKFLPKLNKYQKDFIAYDIPTVAPTALKCSRKNTIVLEDLTHHGYKTVSKRNLFNFEHSAAVLRTLARFHALSVKIQGDFPDIIKTVSKEYYSARYAAKFTPTLVEGFKILADAHEKISETARFGKILREITKFMLQKLVKMVEPSEKFNVLNHGDLWSANILFKYGKDGSVQNAKFVDFQQSRYCSPAMDLHHFLFTSTQPGVLVNRMSELLLLYHETLIKSLIALHMKFDYSFEDLFEDMHEKAAYAVISIVHILPRSMHLSSEVKSQETSVGVKKDEGNEPKNKYENPVFVQLSGEYFSHLQSIGFLSDAISRLQPLVDELDSKKAPKPPKPNKKRRK